MTSKPPCISGQSESSIFIAGDNGEAIDNVPEDKRQLGLSLTPLDTIYNIGTNSKCRPLQCYFSYFQSDNRIRVGFGKCMLEMIYEQLSMEQDICNTKQHSTVVWQRGCSLDHVACRCFYCGLWDSGIYRTRDGVFLSMSVFFCLKFIILRGFRGVEARRIILNIFTVVLNSWWHVLLLCFPS